MLSSLAVVLVRNPVRATLLLILSFLPTSFVYILLQASFVGILQILVYAGAIMMLFTFVIMMINPAPKGGEDPVMGGGPEHGSNKAGALIGLVGLVVAGFLVIPMVWQAASQVSVAAVSKPDFGSLASLSDLLFKDPANNPMTVSFELISFLILVGIIAALNFSRRKAHGGHGGHGGHAAIAVDSITTRPTKALPVLTRAPSPDRK